MKIFILLLLLLLLLITVYNRLFIGCENWQYREKGHTFLRLDHYDPVAVLRTWGKDRCRVHGEILEQLGIKWDEQGVAAQAKCHVVYANLQGGKDKRCPFSHEVTDDSGSIKYQRGNIIQLECEVKFHFFLPVFNSEKPSTNSMAIISYSKHTHPPPPPRKIPPTVRDCLLKAVEAFGISDATARRLIASLVLSIMLNGKTSFGAEHISLVNQDVVNYLIRKERVKQYPWGTDFQGADYLMHQQGNSDPYIQKVEAFSDGHFVVHCQSKNQSRLLMHSLELHVDKTFSRTKCREFEINNYDIPTQRISTLARVFTDYENEEGYFQAFKLVFDQAEWDMGFKIPFSHIIATNQESQSGSQIKALLVDEHGGQIKGLAGILNRNILTMTAKNTS